MTPAMRLSAIKALHAHLPDAEAICHDLERAFSLGHEFGIERAADLVDQRNKEGPYNATVLTRLIRALVIREVKHVRTIDNNVFRDDYLG